MLHPDRGIRSRVFAEPGLHRVGLGVSGVYNACSTELRWCETHSLAVVDVGEVGGVGQRGVHRHRDDRTESVRAPTARRDEGGCTGKYSV